MKVSKADIPKIKALRASGMSDVAIGRRYNVGPSRIGQVAGPRGFRKHPKDWIEEARSLWTDGLTMSEVAHRLDVDRDVIAGIAHRNDFDARPSPIKRAA
ncbi:MAG TPA: hypothetical protein VIM11_18345 [Tepidisphaeraceae bacterium]